MTFKGKFVPGVAAARLALVAAGTLSYRHILDENADAAWVAGTHRPRGLRK